jgi:putative ABC transport system ATP-binding protein
VIVVKHADDRQTFSGYEVTCFYYLREYLWGILSGMSVQRVALARGLVAEPEVLFADEPTGWLDSVSGELVMDLLTAAVRDRSTTVVLVTHDARVAAYAGREIVVRDGKVGTLTGAQP